MGEDVNYPLQTYSTLKVQNFHWKSVPLYQAEEDYCDGCKECENLIEVAKQKGLKKILVEQETHHLRIRNQ
jgi:Fe-S-cluster-containing hydrogenase component 2